MAAEAPGEAGEGRRRQGSGRAPSNFSSLGNNGPEMTSCPLASGMCRVPGWVRGTPGPGRAQGCVRDQPARGGPDGFHPGFLQPRLMGMGGPGVNAEPRPRPCWALWALWVPRYPMDGGADPKLTPTQGSTSPGGNFLRFQILENPRPALPGVPITPGLEEAGAHGGEPGFWFH